MLVSTLGASIVVRVRTTRAPRASSVAATPGIAGATADADGAALLSIPIRGAPVVRGTLVISVSAPGQAVALQQTTLAAEVGGRVERVTARESDVVREGRLLIAIDSTQSELALADARARLSQAQASFREITLFDDKITDAALRAERASVARAKSGLEAAEVGKRRAQLDLARVRLTAPFDGTIADLKVTQGQIVKVGDALLTIQRVDPIRVEVQVLESEVGFLAPGRSASVSFAAFPGKNFRGTIRTINPIVDQATRTARVTVTVDNHDGWILPGMYARVTLDARRFADRILVPRAAILERDRRTMLFVLDGEGGEGLAKWRYVTTGLANDSLVEIVRNPDTEMVKPGEMVLVEGHTTLTHDTRVRLVTDLQNTVGGRPQ